MILKSESYSKKKSILTNNPQDLVFHNKKFIFSTITSDDLESLYRWRRDPVISRYLALPPPETMDDQLRWYEAYLNDPGSLHFMVTRAYGKKSKLGYCQLLRIDQENRSAEFGIIVSEAKLLGSGIGYMIATTFLQICFSYLGLRVVYGSDHPLNSASNKFHEDFVGSKKIAGRHQYRKKDQLLYELDNQTFKQFESRICYRKKQWKSYFDVKKISQ